MKHRRTLLFFLFLLATLTMVDRVCISVTGTAVQQDLGLSPQQWGWVLGSFSIAYGLFEVPSGAWGDRSGPRLGLARIVALWSAFTAFTGMVTSFTGLVVTRFLFGAGEAGAFPNMAACVSRWFAARERARAQGFIWMSSRLGGALSPLLIIPLQDAFGWRTCFLVFGVAGGVWAVAWLLWFRDSPAEMKGVTPEDVARAGIEPAPTGHAGVPWRQFFRTPTMWWILLMYYAYCWSGYFFQGWLFIFLEKGRDFSRAELLAYSWLPFVFGAAANLAGGFAADWAANRWGLKAGRRAIGFTGLLASAGFILLALTTRDPVATIVLLALAYAASDFMLPMAWAVCIDIGGRNSGAVSGAMNMAGQAGGFSTSLAFGYIVGHTGSYNAPLVVMALFTAAAAFLWFAIDPTVRLAPASPAEPAGRAA